MSRRASPLAVGTFIVIGIVLFLAVLFAVGAGHLFRDTSRFVVYFQTDVKGLEIGAPVRFNGIPVGAVEELQVIIAPPGSARGEVWIEAVLRIDQQRFESEGAPIDLDDDAAFAALVDRGLRASLGIESLLTGQRYVRLDLQPGTPVELIAWPGVAYREIPVVPGWGERFQEDAARVISKLAEADIVELVRSARELVDEARALVTSPELTEAFDDLERVTAELETTLAEARKVVATYGRKGKLGRELQATVDEARAAVESVERLVRPQGAFTSELETTLDEVQAAARSLRLLTDRLNRDPGALIRGRGR